MERFKHGDRVCFVGDSITSQNRYVALIVDHYKTNFPKEDIKFFNCGISGGTASILMKYFDEDVFSHKPTHIFVMLGVNDSCRDVLFLPRTQERYSKLKKAYENFKINFSNLCQKAVNTGAKLTVMTPPPYAEYQVSPREALKGGFALISGYADYIRSLSKEKTYETFDIHSFMTEQLQTEILYNDDRVHPNDLGHYCIAKCFLKNQGLDIGEFKEYPEYLEKWRQAVISYREIYAVENMLIQDDTATPDKKVEFIKEYLENKKYLNPDRTEGVNLFFKKVAEGYVENKMRQAELYLQIDKIFDETKNIQ